jgi:hypothetical protein
MLLIFEKRLEKKLSIFQIRLCLLYSTVSAIFCTHGIKVDHQMPVFEQGIAAITLATVT